MTKLVRRPLVLTRLIKDIQDRYCEHREDGYTPREAYKLVRQELEQLALYRGAPKYKAEELLEAAFSGGFTCDEESETRRMLTELERIQGIKRYKAAQKAYKITTVKRKRKKPRKKKR